MDHQYDVVVERDADGYIHCQCPEASGLSYPSPRRPRAQVDARISLRACGTRF